MKIKSGCLALIVKSKVGNIGKSVTVGGFIGLVAGFNGRHRWEVSEPMAARYGPDVYHANEDQLMRIDGLTSEASQVKEISNRLSHAH